jgi:hypothetical protein
MQQNTVLHIYNKNILVRDYHIFKFQKEKIATPL